MNLAVISTTEHAISFLSQAKGKDNLSKDYEDSNNLLSSGEEQSKKPEGSDNIIFVLQLQLTTSVILTHVSGNCHSSALRRRYTKDQVQSGRIESVGRAEEENCHPSASVCTIS
ncbi:hypothetical protein BaRGS_00028246 [Batillaria attramentaria]|uniref:Uncharacterized protein n=1 Tax=Batillaria attramentaria TaxID=370345 RepID=A0ABD0K0N4_9CAEN